MSKIKLDFDTKASKFVSANKVNSLPCRFSADAKSENVDTFFGSTIQPLENKGK